ncbi:hypothetical protein JQX13_50530 [Archangium violaceum]|uniref:hypothetical protein n=1 Tax=Archangium violaceum TaxID=83451 RepID=UPI00193C1419|nr:hypothetical protein [Archangium violaceum]QRK08102.1 hypothetical protein JQX13_50530 [Archangium violaceum]
MKAGFKSPKFSLPTNNPLTRSPTPPPKPSVFSKPAPAPRTPSPNPPDVWKGKSGMDAPGGLRSPPPVPPKPAKLSAPPVPPKPANLRPGAPNPFASPSGPQVTQGPVTRPTTPLGPPTAADFTPPARPFKNTNRPVIGIHTYNPPKQDIPGTRFDHINPSQQHVSNQIVQQKLDSWKANGVPQPISVPVYVAPNTGKLTIAGDGHHTFVAAMKGGYPMDLHLVKMPGMGLPALHSDWQKCTYADFQKGSQWVG